MKPYKEALPKNTIVKILNILNNLDILTTSVNWNNPYKEIYSVRVEAIEEDGGFGTNGKGRNQIYALASAYAEFVERIQNLYMSGASGFPKIFLDYIHTKVGFYYYPDEKFLTEKEFDEIPSNILFDFFATQEKTVVKKNINDIFKILEKEKRKGLVSVPFFNVKNKEIQYIPHSLLLGITGSNGMAAGNTVSEATFQALCELYERNAASIIYYQRIAPPTIDTDYLKRFSEEYKIIKRIEQRGYKVYVKDFSCNLQLPVVGLLIIDKTSNTYRLNIGSDTNFQTALSRTLTEIFQGLNNDNMDTMFLEFPNKDNNPYFFNKDDVTGQEEINNFKNFVKNGGGVFPPSLFNEKYSYVFNENVFTPAKSYEEEVKNLLNLAKNLNYDVYIRDVSFLNFPSVHIYMPKVSSYGSKIAGLDNENFLSFNELDNYLGHFQGLIYNSSEIKIVVNILKTLIDSGNAASEVKVKDLFKLNFKHGTVWNNLTLDFFLTLLLFLIKDYKGSIYYLKMYIKNRKLEDVLYYKEVLKYFNSLNNNTSLNNVPKDVLANFSDPEKLFSNIHFPICPNCVSCDLKNICLTKVNVKNSISIYTKFKESVINQNKFSIFS